MGLIIANPYLSMEEQEDFSIEVKEGTETGIQYNIIIKNNNKRIGTVTFTVYEING